MNKMTDINVHYIHHITEKQYQNAIQFLLNGSVPRTITNSSKIRFKRRWKSAQLVIIGGKRRIFIQGKELIPMNEIEALLQKLYNAPTTGGNLGRDKFYSRVKSKFIGISRTDVQNFLNNDEVHQLYKPIHKLKVVKPLPIPSGPNLYWQMDIIDMGHELKHDNLGFQYILTVIDIFSKYAWAKSLKSKHAKNIVNALKEILSNKSAPKIIQSDNGLEFKNASIAKLLNKFHIKQIFSLPYRPQSQGCIERFNGTIKRMMYAQMARYKTKVWADILPMLIENYNTVIHSSTKYTPSLLHFTDDSGIIQKAKSMLEQRNERWLKKNNRIFPEIKKGDYVRVSNLAFKDYRKESNVLKNSYKPNWSKNIYQVISISKPSNPLHQPLYTIKDKNNHKLRLYRDSLQFLPSATPRQTHLNSRVINPNFHYRELDREIATKARNNTNVSDRLTSRMQREPRKRYPNSALNSFHIRLY